jgi:7,8-dihydropterin-6-yl-methyl-4-(beta-D-ribofuranosyl)aminobenzene 5'-phosphate synthase
MNRIKITVLVEDTAESKDVLTEHGLSFFIETDNKYGLFDTGQTDVIIKNAKSLKLPIDKILWIALSHGHRDHTGGLDYLLKMLPDVDIYGHPDVILPKHIINGDWKSYGISSYSKQIISKIKNRIHFSEDPIPITDNILTTGQIPRKTDYETISKRFYVERDGEFVNDSFTDDLSLILKTSKGIIVLLGCAHSGVVNILNHVKRITGQENIYSVIGGMHLVKAPQDRINKTVEKFHMFGVEKIGLAHCTGKEAVETFFSEFGDKCFLCPVGTFIEF